MSNRREYLGLVATGLTVAVGGCLESGVDNSAATEDDEATTGTDATETETGTDPGTAEGTDTPLSGTVDITGSSTVYPLAQAVVEGFRQRHPDVDFALSITGTGGGFSERFCEGDADFNTASRPISAAERDLCAGNGVEYHELTLARDAVTVVVNADNDWVDCVTTGELRELWRADGATRWADVRSEWPDEEIARFGPADSSGTFDYFGEAVLGENAAHTSDYQPTERDNAVLRGVQNDRYGIAYLGFSYYRDNSDRVKALGIDAEGCVEPSLDSAANGDYPLARPLYTYVNTDRLGEASVAEFARYLLRRTTSETRLTEQVGYVPLTQAAMQAELDALNDVIERVQ
ncbi:PstS family phosphate ABC transporter substrate-binding protein [Haloarcula sp. S1CR25-12]|uniref:PstS family phosphate ABC transporter substrate-binding protein n=1 Tax=Haloarcula saliterrae TaxID=2950534 RepID=A0ABU2FCD6_9EURY|nr:PstS family phosphate ABC transporter substrate-binding protein [Haloarcula sp. S1CR25-12]MDS0259924.1 PstS family phosphate ABC transporter substrate-binding protein [Haloarcula sp. S1CR25-12]